jgi:NodT family efflux transporter outer membrane factor (OMF) lipoprotein
MKIKLLLILLLFVLISTLISCASGPNYKRPCAIVPMKYKEVKKSRAFANQKFGNWKIAQPQDAIDRGRWWEIFKDKELNMLECHLNSSNQNIVTAYANYVQACELVNEAKASYSPVLTASASVTRQKGTGGSTSFISTSGGTTSTGSAATAGLGASIFTAHSYILNATWVPDIWGNVRRMVEASQANAQATDALLAVTRLSAQASLAQFYFQLRALDMDQKILNDTVADYKKALQLTLNRYAAGVAGRGDVVQAQSQLENAQALAINNGINRAVFEHAIAVLMGQPPALFSLPYKPLTHTPPPIPLEIPSALLERRPDIAQAERLMAQANAEIGVAVSAYFPTLTLSAVASVFARGSIFSIPILNWSFGPQLAETIIDGGLRIATVRAAKAGYVSKVASYRQVVLAAFQNVEDNLATLRILTDQAVAQNAAAKSAKHALRIVINEYKAGTAAYTDVIVAQNAAYTAEKAAADITGMRMTAAVGLITALGGGWNAYLIKCDG